MSVGEAMREVNDRLRNLEILIMDRHGRLRRSRNDRERCCILSPEPKH